MPRKIREKLKWLDPFHYVDEYLLPKINPWKSETINWIVYIITAFVVAYAIYAALGLLLSTPSPMMIVMSGSMEPLYYRGDVIALLGVPAAGINAPEIILDKETLKNVPMSSFAETTCEGQALGKAPCEEYIEQLRKGKVTLDEFTATEINFTGNETVEVTKAGTIVVYFSQYQQKPIVHRAVAKLKARDGYYVLTKGDSVNNATVDQDCGDVVRGIPERSCIQLYPVALDELHGKAILHVPLIGCAKLWLFDDLFSLVSAGKLPEDFKGIC